MLSYAQLIIGAVILLLGFYFKQQNKGSVKYTRIYSLVTYFGWAIMVVPGADKLRPLVDSLFPNTNLQLVAALQVILFIVGAELFLKDAFDPAKRKEIDPTKTVYSGRKNSKKKSSSNVNSYGSFKKKK